MAKKKDDLKDELLEKYETGKFSKSSIYTTDELDALRKNVMDNVIGRFAQKLKEIVQVDPSAAKEIVSEYKKRVPDNEKHQINSIQDVVNHVTDYFKYYDAIKTQEELEFEFARAEKFVFYEGIDLPIVVEFDYQYFNSNAIFRKPTFYSYYNPDTKTDFGKGAYHIAFPSSQKYLTDDEVMVAMKHEFGHIFQGHCTVRPKDKFEEQYNNQSMDISINLGMTAEEQELLFSVARKIWKSATICPCMSLAKPEGKGGFNIPVAVSPQDWRGTSGFIRAYYDKKNKQNGEGEGEGGEGEPQDGEGGGSGGSGESTGKQQSSKIKVGDYIYVRGTNPEIHGKVNRINETTGEIQYDEYTEDQWEIEKANIKAANKKNK